MRRSLLAVILVACFALMLHAEDKHPYTFDDHISMNRLSGPALSPDGKWIAYSQTSYDMTSNSGSTSIFLVPSAGGKPQLFVKGSSPVWSPDGSSIAFSRAGQIWLISMKGGEAKQLTELATGADGAKWSHDGTQILFSSMVWPGLNDEENTKKLEEMDKSKVKAFATEELLFRHWNTWRSDGRKQQLFIVDVKTGKHNNITPDITFDVPPFPFGGSSDYAFSPDDKEVAFFGKIAPGPAWNTNLDLFIVSAQGGEITNLTEANKAQDSGPVIYSPDGKYIAYGAMERPGFEADRIQLMLYDRVAKTTRSISSSFDSSPGGWLWTKDSKGLYFTADEKGRTPVFHVSVAGNDVKKVVNGHSMHGLQLSTDEKTLYFARQSLSAPVDIFSAKVDGSSEAQITFANADILSNIEMSKVEEIYIKGANDEDLQIFMLYPPGFDATKKWPVVVLIHGGPQGTFGDDFHYRWNAQLFAAPGYIAACVNFHGSTSFGQKYTDSISKNWGGLPYIDIMKSMDYLTSLDYVAPDRIGAAGGSYGGYMVNWIATQTDRFSALVSHAGVYNLESMYGATEELWFPEWEFDGPFWENREHYEKWSPSRFAANMGKFKTPTLVIHGQHDYRVIVTQGFEMFTALQRQGVPSRLLYYPDETHFVLKPQNAELWYREVHDWYERWLGAGPK